MEAESIPQRCARCGRPVDIRDCWLARGRGGAGEEEAAFCRLEHVVPWVIRGGGAGWESGSVALVRLRGAHQVVEEFENTEKMREWAVKGGPWT